MTEDHQWSPTICKITFEKKPNTHLMCNNKINTQRFELIKEHLKINVNNRYLELYRLLSKLMILPFTLFIICAFQIYFEINWKNKNYNCLKYILF